MRLDRLWIGLLPLVAACTLDAPAGEGAALQQVPPVEGPGAASARLDATAAAPPADPPPPLPPALVLAPQLDGFNAFAIELFRTAPRDAGLALSPLVVEAAFALAVPGAKGATREELRKTLRHVADDDAVLETLRGILQAEAHGCELTSASRAFVQSGFGLVSEYEELLGRSTGSQPARLDFAGDPGGAGERINQWVRVATAGAVSELVPSDGIDTQTRLVLGAATRFIGAWQEPFGRAGTRGAPFRLLDGGLVDVPTMQGRRSARFARVEDARLLELPFGCEGYAMLFVLPETGEPDPPLGLAAGSGLGLGGLEEMVRAGRARSDAERAAWDERLAELRKQREEAAAALVPKPLPPGLLRRALEQIEAGLSPERLQAWDDALAQQPVIVRLPRFRVRTAGQMKEQLQRLGIRRAFGPEADFSGIAPERLQIDHVFHEAVVEVDEEGVRATAAGAVVLGSRGTGPPQIERFYADRPFLFLLRDTRTGAILFLGRVVDPRG